MIFFMRFMGSISSLRSTPLKKSIYLLSALLIAACQPSPPTTEPVTAENSETVNNPPIISTDSVTLTPDHILTIKPTRYQPSLGLEGRIEPIKQVNIIAAQPLTVEQVLVSKNQLVKKGTPLFIVRRQATPIKPINLSDEEDLSAVKSLSNNAANNHNLSPKSTLTDNTVQTRSSVDGDANLEDADVNNGSLGNTADATTAKQSYNLMTVRASFSGRVENLSIQAGQQINPHSTLLSLSDETTLHFIATLPIEAKSQISVGQTVNFTAEGRIDEFTGQVSKISTSKQPIQLLVYVNVVNNEVSRNQILPDMKVIGRVDYGQIGVGTIVPKRALYNVNLTTLHAPPYKPLRPLIANVWIIGQDQRLIRQPVEVIEYNPVSKQYLIAGISNDSLICLANLPIESKGKKVVVS